jgi:hypothetical protein
LSIEEHINRQQISHGKANQKDALLRKISNKEVSADEIKIGLNSNIITFDDINNNVSISDSVKKSLRHFCNSNRIPSGKTIEELPPMEEGRTDIYFVGLPGSGKSTMLSGILYSAFRNGTLLPDPYNHAGSVFQVQLVDDLSKGVLPAATPRGSYNYVALSLMGENRNQHPFNIVEVPGENYVQIFNNGNVADLLNYINNRNKKILVFVIDSLSHESGYINGKDQLNQSLVYVNILQLFHDNGILDETDAVYLVANKFDAIKNGPYGTGQNSDEEIAHCFLQNEFLNLINNCKAIRDASRNKFRITVLPFSIGNVTFNDILENYESKYSENLIEHILADSFVIKGGNRLKKLFK